MKHVCLILATFVACIAMMHAATNDYIWSQKPASGPLVSRNLTPTVGRLIGFPSSIDAPATIIIGSGLTLTGSTLTASGSGTVTSVAMSVPSILAISGSPVTTSGTLAVTLATQAANRIFAGPATGADATPTFRSLVTADIPSSVALLAGNQIFTDTNIFAVGPTEELVVLAESQGLRLRDNAVDTNTINLIEVQDEDGEQTLIVDSGGALTAVGAITAASFSGTGSALTGLNGSNISSGTVADARLSANVSLLGSSIAIGSEVSGLGTGIAAALAINTGSTGAPLLVGGTGSIANATADDTAYDATSWNASTAPPTKNAVRDKFESLSSGGKVLQMIVSSKTDTTSVAATTWATMMSGTITPTSASSRIVVFAVMATGHTVGGGYPYFLRISRSGTPLVQGDAAGSRERTQISGYNSQVTALKSETLLASESPSSTSALTYDIEGKTGNAGTTLYINRSSRDSNTANEDARGASYMVILEVAP